MSRDEIIAYVLFWGTLWGSFFIFMYKVAGQ